MATGPIRNCTPPSSEFRRSFEDATVQDIAIKGGQAGAKLSNGEAVELFHRSGDLQAGVEEAGGWLIHKLGGNAGRLLPESPATVPASGPFGVAIAPDGKSVYVADNSAVRQFSVDADGKLTPKTPATVAGVTEGLGVAVTGEQPPQPSPGGTPSRLQAASQATSPRTSSASAR